MHVGFYADEYRLGGITTLLVRIGRELRRQGDRVTFFFDRPYPKRSVADRASYRRFQKEMGGECVVLNLVSYPPGWREAHLAETVRNRDIDCLFASLHRPQLAGLERLSRHVPVVGIAHTDHSYFYDEFLAALPFLAAQVGVSQKVAERCRHLAGPPREGDVRHILNGVEPAGEEDAPPDGPFKVIYCSRLDPIQKRTLDLAPIWKAFLARGGSGMLSVIGDGKASAALRQELQAEEKSGSVRFHGQLEEQAVLREMATGDVILNISNFEGLPQAVPEGTARGLWPLLSDCESGHPEIVQLLGCGTLCRVGDGEAFAAALLDLASRRAALRAGRADLRARTRRCFDLADTARRYHELAAEKALPAPAGGSRAVLHRPSFRERVKRLHLLLRHGRYLR